MLICRTGPRARSGRARATALIGKARLRLMVKPPPRTPNFPATAGSARMARTAWPPLRLRSTPQPQRTTAGDAAAYASTSAAMSRRRHVALGGGARRAAIRPPGAPARRSRRRARRGTVDRPSRGATSSFSIASASTTSVPGRGARWSVGGARQRRAARIDHRDEGAGALRGAHVRHQMDAGGRRIDAPQQDGARAAVVLAAARRPWCRTWRAPRCRSAPRRSSSAARRHRAGGRSAHRPRLRRTRRWSRRSDTAGSPRRRRSAMMRRKRSAMSAMASSQVMRSKRPSPLAPTRRCG